MQPPTAGAGTLAEEWLSVHGDLVYRLCRRLCDDSYGAEDLFQETWLRALSALARRSPPDQPDKWLITLCLNAWRDQCRRKRTLRRLGLAERDGILPAASAPDPGRGPEAQAVDADEGLRLRRAVNGLRERLRVPVILYYFHNLSVDDVAGILGVKSGTVKSRLHAARRQIRKEMNEDERMG